MGCGTDYHRRGAEVDDAKEHHSSCAIQSNIDGELHGNCKEGSRQEGRPGKEGCREEGRPRQEGRPGQEGAGRQEGPGQEGHPEVRPSVDGNNGTRLPLES